MYKRREDHSTVSPAAVQLTPVPLLYPQTQAWCRRYLFLTTPPIIMFSKATLISLALGALYVNAMTVPVAREPTPELDCEFPRSLLTISYLHLTFAPSTVQDLEARIPQLRMPTSGRMFPFLPKSNQLKREPSPQIRFPTSGNPYPFLPKFSQLKREPSPQTSLPTSGRLFPFLPQAGGSPSRTAARIA